MISGLQITVDVPRGRDWGVKERMRDKVGGRQRQKYGGRESVWSKTEKRGRRE